MADSGDSESAGLEAVRSNPLTCARQRGDKRAELLEEAHQKIRVRRDRTKKIPAISCGASKAHWPSRLWQPCCGGARDVSVSHVPKRWMIP